MARTRDKAHGRIETRRIEVTSTLATHLVPTWPGVAQVCRLTRQRRLHGKQSTETVYAIASLTAAEATPARLLALARTHWGIENRLHYVRDVAWGEDQGRTRTGAAPQVLAALRNAALTLRVPFKTAPPRPGGQ